MKITFPVSYRIHSITTFGFTLRGIYNAMSRNISGSINSVIMPAVSSPEGSQAPWFDGQGWYIWDRSINNYRPVYVKAGNVMLSSSPSANRIQQLQNKSGTVALLDDAYNMRDTVSLREGLVGVDWDKGNNFQCVLAANRKSVFYMIHSKAGMEIDILIVNNGTDQTVDWDSAIKWPSGVSAQPPPATPGRSMSVRATLKNIGGTIYGEFINYGISPVTDASVATGLISL